MNKLKHTHNRILVKVDVEQKNHYTMEGGIVIRMERDYNNLDRSYTQQTLGEVISSDYIPEKSLILFHFNSLHPSNEIYNYTQLSGEIIASNIKIFSLPENECYLWKEVGKDEWMPLKGFATGLRVYKPYVGLMQGIEPTKIPNTLYITSGELKGNVCHTLKAADYNIIFRNEKGVDEHIIRCRHFEKGYNEREEIIAIDHLLTKQVENGELLIGTLKNKCKTLKENYAKL